MRYKFEYDYDSSTGLYGETLIFTLDDGETEILKDSASADTLTIPITVENGATGIPVGAAEFCRACSTTFDDRYGDSCWAFTEVSDNNSDVVVIQHMGRYRSLLWWLVRRTM